MPDSGRQGDEPCGEPTHVLRVGANQFGMIAADVAADLEAVLEQFATIAEDLKGGR